MKLNKVPLIASLLTAGALLINPVKAQTIDFRIGDVMKKSHYSEQGEPLQNIEILLRNIETGNNIAQLTTDENGRARYDPNSVISPNYDFNLSEIQKIEVFDAIGRKVNSYSNLEELSDINASGAYFYRVIDQKGNGLTGKLIDLERDLFGLPYHFNANKRSNPKGRASTDNLFQMEITIKDENTDGIGNFYDFKDTLSFDDNGSYEIMQDLIPVWEIEEWNVDIYGDSIGGNNNFRNNLHEIKWMTQTDPNGQDVLTYLRKWNNYPVLLFFNREDDHGYNIRALEHAINEWESSTRYGDYEQLNLFEESEERPTTGILMDYTTDRSSGTRIADAWLTHNVGGQTYYSPRIVTIYIGNNLGENYSNQLISDSEHEPGHAIMASRSHSRNRADLMAGALRMEILPQEGKLVRYIILEKPFTRMWNYLEN